MPDPNILLIEDEDDWTNKIKGDLIAGLSNEIPNIRNSITISKTYRESNAYLENPKWNLVIVDIYLLNDRDKSGLPLIRTAVSKKFPVIVISNHIGNDEWEALRDGSRTKGCLEKFSKDEYNVKIRDIIEVAKEILCNNHQPSICNYELKDDDIRNISVNLARIALNSNGNNYFYNLVEQLELPEESKELLSEKWIDNLELNIIQLIISIQDIDTSHSNTSRQAGTTFLGNLIEIMLSKSKDKKLLSIIKEHNLITDKETLSELEKKCNLNIFEYDVFICHSSQDKRFIKENILPDLQLEGITYWFDDDQISWGGNIPIKVQDGLRKSRYIMPCLSVNFSSSHWANNEYSAFFMNMLNGTSEEERIKPLKIDKCDDNDIPYFLNCRKWADYCEQEEFVQRLRSLKSSLG
ncbi:MAG: TIR domain-containing protein [Cyanobacteria bacterium P01_G01_bin.39]